MTDTDNEKRADQDAGRTSAPGPPPSDLRPPNSELGTRTPEHMIEPPPIMKSWRRFYGLVILVLAADVVVFWVVTRVFS